MSLISVVVPTLNRAHYLPETLHSILSQDYANIECIVVDGGSTDGTQELLAQYGSRIRWLSEPDAGPFDAINKGWTLATGDLLAWLNADDLWAEGAARRVADYFAAHLDTDVLAGACAYVDDKAQHVIEYTAEWDLVRVVAKCDCTIYQPGTFYRAAAIARVKGLRHVIPHDFDLWLRLSLAGCTFDTVPDILGKTRIQDDNISHNPSLMIAGMVGAIRSFFNAPELPLAFHPLRRRALCNAHLWGFVYLLKPGKPAHWLWAIRCVVGACLADPAAIPYVIGRIASGTRWRTPLRETLSVIHRRLFVGQ